MATTISYPGCTCCGSGSGGPPGSGHGSGNAINFCGVSTFDVLYLTITGGTGGCESVSGLVGLVLTLRYYATPPYSGAPCGGGGYYGDPLITNCLAGAFNYPQGKFSYPVVTCGQCLDVGVADVSIERTTGSSSTVCRSLLRPIGGPPLLITGTWNLGTCTFCCGGTVTYMVTETPP